MTNSVDSKGILYIDLELLAYAVKTLYRPRPSDLAIGLGTFVIRIIDPVKTIGSAIIGSVMGFIVKRVTNTSINIGSIVLIIIVYTSQYRPYKNNLISDVKVNNQNIEYVLKHSESTKILVFSGESPPECLIYENDGQIVSDKDKSNSNSIILEHKPKSKEKDRMWNRRIRTLRNLPE